MPSPLRNLTGKWLAVSFLLLSAGIGALWYSALTTHEKVILEESGNELQAIADLKISYIRFWLDERLDDTLIPGSAPLMARAVDSGPVLSDTGGMDLIPGRLETFRKAHGYKAVTLLDRSGAVRAEAGPISDEARRRSQTSAANAMAQGKTVVSRSYRSDTGGTPQFDIDIATPVISEGRPAARIVGALVFQLNPRAHLDTLMRHWPATSESGETLLVERSDGEIIFLSSLRHADAPNLRMSVDEPSLPAAMAARGQRGVMAGIDYRGVPVLSAIGPVPGMPWYVVAKRDREEILAPIRREAWWSGGLSALLVLALGLAMFSWWRRSQSELALAEQAATKQALAASEARFRKLHNQGWDINLLFDQNMHIVYASPTADRYIGRPAKGEPISTGTALVHPDDVAIVETARRAALSNPGVPQYVNHRFIKQEGGWWTVEACFTNYFDDPDIGALSYVSRDISERIKAERILQESEARYRSLFEQSPDAIIVYRNNLAIFANEAATRLLHADSARELAGRDWHEFIVPEDWAATGERAAALSRGDASFLAPLERRCMTLDGQVFPAELSAAAIVFDGEPAIFSVMRDITGRKRMEQALRDSEGRYRFLFEHNPLPMWVYDIETLAFLEVNRTAVAQYGYTQQEFLAMTLRDIRPPEDIPAMEEAAKSASRLQGRIWTHRRKDGSLLKAAIWSQPAFFAGRPARMILAENVTDRIEAERALAESEARLRSIIDSAPVGIGITDANGRYLLVNPSLCRMTGYSEADLLQKTYADITHPDDVAGNVDLNARMRGGEISSGSMEKRYVRKDGSVLWVLLTVGLVRTASGEILGSVGVAQDTTEQREAERQRIELARQQRDTLVREVHHRIKNHLQGLAGLLRQHMQAQPGLAPALQKISAQIAAISIVHGLQSRVGNGAASLRSLAAEIAAFLNEITGSRICLSHPATACAWGVAEAEAVPLALILNELLTNALRHGEDRTQVSLDIRCDAAGAQLIIRNPGRLEGDLDFVSGKGLGTGLGLIRSLLPPEGAKLGLGSGETGWVETRLELAPPVLQSQEVSLR